jgi:ABC-type antimicrobial peptide transport system permease subunit
VSAGAVAGVFLALTLGTYTASLVKGAAPGPRLIALAFAVLGILATTAIWSATRQVSRLDISDVLRAESAD